MTTATTAATAAANASTAVATAVTTATAAAVALAADTAAKKKVDDAQASVDNAAFHAAKAIADAAMSTIIQANTEAMMAIIAIIDTMKTVPNADVLKSIITTIKTGVSDNNMNINSAIADVVSTVDVLKKDKDNIVKKENFISAKNAAKDVVNGSALNIYMKTFVDTNLVNESIFRAMFTVKNAMDNECTLKNIAIQAIIDNYDAMLIDETYDGTSDIVAATNADVLSAINTTTNAIDNAHEMLYAK